MSEILEKKYVPKWRLILYGLLATASIGILGFYLHERYLIIAAVFVGVVIVGFGLSLNWLLNWGQTKPTTQRLKIGRWLIFIGLLVVISLKFLDLLP